MLAGALKLLPSTTTGTPSQSYADEVKFASYARDSIKIVTEAGLMQGIQRQGKFYFDPTALTTRESAAKVLYQWLQAAQRI